MNVIYSVLRIKVWNNPSIDRRWYFYSWIFSYAKAQVELAKQASVRKQSHFFVVVTICQTSSLVFLNNSHSSSTNPLLSDQLPQPSSSDLYLPFHQAAVMELYTKSYKLWRGSTDSKANALESVASLQSSWRIYDRPPFFKSVIRHDSWYACKIYRRDEPT